MTQRELQEKKKAFTECQDLITRCFQSSENLVPYGKSFDFEIRRAIVDSLVENNSLKYLKLNPIQGYDLGEIPTLVLYNFTKEQTIFKGQNGDFIITSNLEDEYLKNFEASKINYINEQN